MRWLPQLSGESTINLPLPDCSSLALESTLLTRDPEDRCKQFTELLGQDPALTLWSLSKLRQTSAPGCETVAELATRLAENGPDCFAALSDRAGNESELETEIALRAATLAAKSVVLADTAEQVAQAQGSPDPAATRLAGLLYYAPQWLTLCDKVSVGPSDSPDPAISECLATALAAIEQQTDSEVLDVAQIREQSGAIYARWQLQDLGTRERLPGLIERLLRLESLESDFQRTLETEKLESLRQLAYGAGHEINNPLANISVHAQTLIKSETDTERRRRLATINRQAFRAHDMIADLMLISRPPELNPERVDLVELVDSLIEELREEAQQQGTKIVRSGTDSPLYTRIDPVQLSVAVRAMCQNSLNAIGSGGGIDLAVRQGPPSDTGASVELVVSDDGPGIEPEVRRHLFDPFYSGREAGRGLGFGLSKCWRIITDHGGTIAVESSPGHGAQFSIVLPAD